MSPSTWSIKRVVNELSDSKQATDLLRERIETDGLTKQRVIHGITEQWGGRFRKVFVERMGADWQSERALLALNSTDAHSSIQEAFQSAYQSHVESSSTEIITKFLDSLNIAHTNGSIDNPDDYDLATEEVLALVTSMRQQYADEDLSLYLAVAGLDMPGWSSALWTTLDAIREDTNIRAVEELHIEDEIVPEAVIPELSTILDDIVTRAIVASVAGEEGTPPPSFLEDGIDELITLNTSRSRSYFHRGYFHALVGTDDRTPSSEQNEQRRQWELTGKLFGLARRADGNSVLDCWTENSGEIERLMGTRHGAGPRVLPLVWRALWESQNHSDALRLLRPEVLANTTLPFKTELLENAKSHRRSGLVDEARVILDALESALEIEDVETEGYVVELLRERAVCIRTQGLFEEAATLISELIDSSAEELSGDLHALLGLCKAQFRTVSEVTCLVEADQVPAEARRLREQIEHFELALKSEQSVAVAIGAHCLGVLAFLEKNPNDATDLLSKSQSAALRGRQSSSNRPFIDQIQIALALSTVLALEQSRFSQAVETLGDVKREDHVIPEWAASGLIDVALYVSDQKLRLDLLTALVNFAPNSRDYLMGQAATDPEYVPESIADEIRTEFVADITSPEDKWKYGVFLSKWYVAMSDLDSARECLDYLERLALDHDRFKTSFTDLFKVEGQFGSSWSQEDISWSLVGIYERVNEYENAIEILRQQFHFYAAEGMWAEAYGVFERTKSYGLDPKLHADMERRILGEFETTELPLEDNQDLGPEERINVLFVGGHEPHAKYDERIKSVLAEKTPWINVDFAHPGWSTNWSETAETLISRFPNYDALVIMTLIRTNLGRKLRKVTKENGLVWISCTGGGRKSVEQAVRRGAELALRKKERDSQTV